MAFCRLRRKINMKCQAHWHMESICKYKLGNQLILMLTQYSTKSCDYGEVEKKYGLNVMADSLVTQSVFPGIAESASPGHFLNANFWAPPRCTESESLGRGRAAVCFKHSRCFLCVLLLKSLTQKLASILNHFTYCLPLY